MLAQVQKADRGPQDNLSNFKVNVGGLLSVIQKQKAKTEDLKRESDSKLGYMPDVTKVSEGEAPVLQNYFQQGKNEIFELDQELKMVDDPVARQELMMKKSQIENSAKAANGYLTDKAELANEWRENIQNISSSMDPEKYKNIDSVLNGQAGTDYTIEFNDYSGKPTYVLPNGTKMTHEEIDDFYYKDDATALTINDGAESFHNNGLSGKDLTQAKKDIYKTKLNNSIKDEGSINSLLTDGLIEGMSFEDAVKGLPENATFEQKKEAVINNIMEHMEKVHEDGKKIYDTKQNVDDTGITKPVDGSIPFISTRNQGDFLWYEEFGGYGPGIPNPAGGVMKDSTLTKDKVISDPDALNTMAVGLGDIKFGK
jgi:hypothetical protein